MHHFRLDLRQVLLGYFDFLFCDARLLCAPAKLGVGCSLMALAGLAALLGVVRAWGETAITVLGED
jgi:hypothetical protein